MVEKPMAKINVEGVSSNRMVPEERIASLTSRTMSAPNVAPTHATDGPDHPRLRHEFSDHAASAGTDRPAHADLAGALGDGHRHRVDDRHAADDQADDGDPDDDRVEGAGARPIDRVVPGAGQCLHVGDPALDRRGDRLDIGPGCRVDQELAHDGISRHPFSDDGWQAVVQELLRRQERYDEAAIGDGLRRLEDADDLEGSVAQGDRVTHADAALARDVGADDGDIEPVVACGQGPARSKDLSPDDLATLV